MNPLKKVSLLLGLGVPAIFFALGFGGYRSMNNTMRNSSLADRAEIVQIYQIVEVSKRDFLYHPIDFGKRLAVKNYQTSPCEQAVEPELEDFITTCYTRTPENLHDDTLDRITKKRDQKLAEANLPKGLVWRCDTFGYKAFLHENSLYGVEMKVLENCQ